MVLGSGLERQEHRGGPDFIMAMTVRQYSLHLQVRKEAASQQMLLLLLGFRMGTTNKSSKKPTSCEAINKLLSFLMSTSSFKLLGGFQK